MKRSSLSFSIAVLFAGAVGHAGETPRLDGTWEGALAVAPSASLRLVLHVAGGAGGALRATLDSPDQRATGLPVDSISLNRGTVDLSMNALHASFHGRMNGAGTEIVGEWKQGGAALPLTLRRAASSAIVALPPSSPPTEIWEGKLKVEGGIELRLGLRVSTGKDGTLSATLVSPDQGNQSIPIDSVTRGNGTLVFKASTIKGEYAGKLDPAAVEAVGEWKQMGRVFPLTLRKTDKMSEQRRPQTPKPPFPYREEQVAYENQAGKVKLAGTLTLPAGAGPFPAALLITGSGAQDRDETLLGHKPFLVIADALTRRGIAVLRVDDRGVGGSTGSVSSATSEDFAGDVLAGVALLKGRKEIDPKRIGLVGHSEGGLIAPMVAARSRDVAFIVLLAGPGLPGDEIIVRQGTLIARAAGEPEEAIARQEKAQRRIFAILKTEKDEAAALAKVRVIVKEQIAAAPPAEKKLLDDSPAGIDAMVAPIRTPWFRYFISYDPRPTLRKVRCPVLALAGEKDLQVPPKEDLAEIAKALAAGGNHDVTTRVLPGLNHLFQTATTGSPAEYARIEETVSPAMLAVVGDWIRQEMRVR